MSQIEFGTPSERINKLREEIKKKRSIRGLRTAMSEVFHAKPADMHEFSFNVGNHKFRGVMYTSRNSLMGSLAYIFDNKKEVLRAYPKIKYSDDSRILNREVIAEEKVDGTCLILWRLPDGTIAGKTRLTPYWKGHKSYFFKDQTWEDLLKKADGGETYPKIVKLLEDRNVTIFGELYGSELPHDFVKYQSPAIGFKLFDIVDRETNRFLPPLEALKIADQYGIPRVAIRWQGILTSKEVERIELELDKSMDVEEGWVAKAYFPDEGDCYFCKLKTASIKEKCWEVSKSIIPTAIIRKAITKTLENYPEVNTIEEMEKHVVEELREEVEQSLIDSSLSRVRALIRKALVPSNEELFKLVVEKMRDLKARGVDLQNKNKVLPVLASALGTISGGQLYRLYVQALREVERR